MLSVGILGDEDETDVFEDVETDDDLGLNDFSDHLYFPRSAEGG